MGFIIVPSRFFYIIHSVASSGKLLQVIPHSYAYMLYQFVVHAALLFMQRCCLRLWLCWWFGKDFWLDVGDCVWTTPAILAENKLPYFENKTPPRQPQKSVFLEKVKNSDLNMGYGLSKHRKKTKIDTDWACSGRYIGYNSLTQATTQHKTSKSPNSRHANQAKTEYEASRNLPVF